MRLAHMHVDKHGALLRDVLNASTLQIHTKTSGKSDGLACSEYNRLQAAELFSSHQEYMIDCSSLSLLLAATSHHTHHFWTSGIAEAMQSWSHAELKQAHMLSTGGLGIHVLWLQAPPAAQAGEGNKVFNSQTGSTEPAARAVKCIAGTGTVQWAQHACPRGPGQDAACARSFFSMRCGGHGSRKCTSAYSNARESGIKKSCLQGSSKPASPPQHGRAATQGSGLRSSKSINCTWGLMLPGRGILLSQLAPLQAASQRSLKRNPHVLLRWHHSRTQTCILT